MKEKARDDRSPAGTWASSGHHESPPLRLRWSFRRWVGYWIDRRLGVLLPLFFGPLGPYSGFVAGFWSLLRMNPSHQNRTKMISRLSHFAEPRA